MKCDDYCVSCFFLSSPTPSQILNKHLHIEHASKQATLPGSMLQKIPLFLAFCLLVAVDGRGPIIAQPLALNAHHLYFDSAIEGRTAWTAGLFSRHSLKPIERLIQHAIIPEHLPIVSTWAPASKLFDSNALFLDSHCPKSVFIRGPPHSIS